MVCEASAVLLLLAALLPVLLLVVVVDFWPAAQEGHWSLGLAGSQL